MIALLLLLLFADPKAATLLREGLLAMESGHLQEAENNLKQATRLDEANPYAWSALAETERRLNRNDDAMKAAETAERMGGNDPVICHALAMFYSQMDRPDRASPLERKFAESPKADGRAMTRVAALEDNWGRALAAQQKMADARAHFQKAWELSAASPDAQIAFDYAQSLLEQQMFDQAADVATKTLAAQPKNAQMELVLGVARYGQRRFDDAIAAFLEVIQIDPEIVQPYLFLSNLLEQAGPALDRIVAADEAWVAREPQNGQAKLTLAKALVTKDRKSERARNLLKEAIGANDAAWEPHYQLGVWFENARDYADAATELRRSIELNPKQPLPHYHLARVYDRLGQSEDARREREIHQSLGK